MIQDVEGISDTSHISAQRVGSEEQDKEVLKPLIINGVEVKLHASELTVLLAIVQDTRKT